MDEYDYLFKILLIGSSGVGKSSILLRYTDDEFNSHWMSTIGVDFKVKTLTRPDNKKVKIQIWDTAGQERFRSITHAYYRGAHGIFLVFDVTDRVSFNDCKRWWSDIEHHARDDVCVFLIGNKVDLEKHRAVSKQEAELFVKRNNITAFIESSAKTNINIGKMFQDITSVLLEKIPPVHEPTEPILNPFDDEEKVTLCGCSTN